MHLAVAGWIGAICFFVGGTVTVMLLGGIIGMLIGAFVYAMVRPRITGILALGSMGKQTVWGPVARAPAPGDDRRERDHHGAFLVV